MCAEGARCLDDRGMSREDRGRFKMGQGRERNTNNVLLLWYFWKRMEQEQGRTWSKSVEQEFLLYQLVWETPLWLHTGCREYLSVQECGFLGAET